MKTSAYWYQHFAENLKNQRINWSLQPNLTTLEKSTIIKSLQAWQLGETSDGKNLIAASSKYAATYNDPEFLHAVKLFIREEQKHGENMGIYLDRLKVRRIKHNWGDSLFRMVRYFNTNMEIWTLTVITVESTAQLYYQSLKNATGCTLLKQICTDILTDEAYHINFQFERLSIITRNHSTLNRWIRYIIYSVFFFSTITMVYLAHRKVFRAGSNNYNRYFKKMKLKFDKTIKRLFVPSSSVYKSQLKWEQIKM